ncbi:MAG: TetR/AcrR family transcriptional regulator [Terracidiphilus sp.]
MSKNVRTKATTLPARFAKPMPQNSPLSAVEPLSMRTADARVRRTRMQLGTALLNLIIEKPINDVTVQDILDRSGVGRSTFYLHYRDKDDLLVSQLETFLETISNSLSDRKDKSHRVMPVAELFAHIGNQNKLYRVLSDSGHLKDFFELAEGFFARGIERRLTESGKLTKVPQRELAARASALSGSLLSLLRWWLDRGEKESPEEMDRMFHRMLWTGLQ